MGEAIPEPKCLEEVDEAMNKRPSPNKKGKVTLQSSINNHRSIVRRTRMVRVLLVEDNRIYRKALKENLCGHFPSMVIDEAVNSEEALQKINATPPHLIFIDMRLPGMNGLELTQKIKRDFLKIRVVIVTGYNLP